MDLVTKNIVRKFAAGNSLDNLSESEQFEALAGYCVMSTVYDQELDPEQIRFGSGDDLGIDCGALVVNGDLITTSDEIQGIAAEQRALDATIVVVQAKMAENFDGHVISNLASNLREFFDAATSFQMNSDVRDFHDLVQVLYEYSEQFRNSNPDLVIAYVTSGDWGDAPFLVEKKNQAVSDLKKLHIFGNVDFRTLGARDVQSLYRNTTRAVEATLVLSDHVVLPEIPGVQQGYFGLVDAGAYRSAISDESGNIRKSLFYDNVRDFQGANPVNDGIARTLETLEGRQRFAVLNNGVTVVARDLRIVGSKFTISDFQVVNGCQTSHVLFGAPDLDGTKLAIKLIVTQNEELASSITAATNKQTVVSDEDLQALENFHKQLEDYFQAHGEDKQLFYERRSRQYSTQSNIEKTRIVSRGALVRAYAAMFLDEPRLAGRYVGQLRKSRAADLFALDDALEPYYVAAVAAYRLEFAFRNNLIDKKYKPARYHILYAMHRIMAHGNPAPASSRRRRSKYYFEMSDKLWSADDLRALLDQIVPAVDAAVAVEEADGVLDRDTVRTQSFIGTLAQQISKRLS